MLFRSYGALNFSGDYAISSQAVAHDTILEGSGNDFMSVVYRGDSCYAVWGDVRTGTLKIYLNKWHVGNPQNHVHLIAEEYGLKLFPNPSHDYLTIDSELEGEFDYRIINEAGKVVQQMANCQNKFIDVRALKGQFIIELFQNGKTYRSRFIRS